jgi:phage terminase large subunit-like protein
LSGQTINAEIPEKLAGLFTPSRYKVLYGGRGSGKSWGVARALTIKAFASPLRILCTREFQNSIEESVHKLLCVQIESLGLTPFFDIKQRSITCTTTGSEFIFEGIRMNVQKIKSMEGIDIAWVEEAQVVPESSWSTLVPTIRQAGSEIWVTYNPDLEEDATHQRFVVHQQADSIVIKINWSDNPWFPEELRREMLALKARDQNAYLNVWEGECRNQVDNPLWTKETINGCREPAWSTEDERKSFLENLKRIVVAVDPSGASGPDDKRSDEIGIVVAGVGHDGIGRVLEDLSGRYSPEGWSRIACDAYSRWKADKVVAEKNFGGAMVESTIRTANKNVPVKLVDASRGKQIRAEPVAALYEQGKIKHAAFFPELERQMLQFSTSGYRGAKSPDRADALVHGVTELMLAPSTTGMLDYAAQEIARLKGL